jgi:GT2 family glycosyltransferase
VRGLASFFSRRMVAMALSVVIVNWRNEADTVRCVKAVRGWRSLNPQILVVDNESTEGSRETLSQFAEAAELIRSEANLGYGGGNNLGIRRALEGDTAYILLLNSDAEIAEHAVNSLIERLEAHPEVSILGPIIRERSEGRERSYIGGRDIALSTQTRIAAETADLGRIPGCPLVAVDYVPGTVLLARRAAFERTGLLDESFFFSGEIADFCRRARAAKHGSFVDLDVSASHDATRVPQGRRDTLYAYYSLRNRMLYARKHYPSKTAKHLAFWTGVCAMEIAKSLKKRNFSRSRAIWLALLHGYANRSGNQNAAFLS